MSKTAQKSHIADLSLADAGRERIEWADSEMSVLRSIRERFERERPFDGLRIAACLHVTAETANLIRTLIAGGAKVGLCASNPLSTQDDVAAALVAIYGAQVHAVSGEDTDTYYKYIEALIADSPQIALDDGADLISLLHLSDQGERVIGAVEDTTTGVLRLRALAAERELQFPIVSVSEAQTKQLFDNRYGTGQSTLDGILRATNLLLAGRTVAIFGYGGCGKGIALRARGAGATVIICEVDPVRALEAKMDGYAVMRARAAAKFANLLITATGSRDVLTAEHFSELSDGAILSNAGHFDVEIDVAGLDELAVSHRSVRPFVEEYLMADGRRLNLLAQGRVVNLASGEGHPPSVMDLSFANQALAVEYLVKANGTLDKKIYAVSDAIDAEIAALKLNALGVRIDSLSVGQQEYLTSWERGT